LITDPVDFLKTFTTFASGRANRILDCARGNACTTCLL
jgi:hypothetical protein